jgi:hypothetical protein
MKKWYRKRPGQPGLFVFTSSRHDKHTDDTDP